MSIRQDNQAVSQNEESKDRQSDDKAISYITVFLKLEKEQNVMDIA
nr:MAG TPA: hypothetical protein [Caudoviricetes sp.]DAR54316.1 MAG TPA: hypothetical protein [Caudoviricetes sp.]DAY31946.1 MAG TPA: hypothetical protein [Caudoviricetes sp.]